MAQFGALCPDLRPNIQVLLERCQMDTDDEVRDRATYYHNILATENASLISHYIVDSLQVSVPGLEKALIQYRLTDFEEPFDMSTVPLAAVATEAEAKAKASADPMFSTPGNFFFIASLCCSV